MRALVLAAAVSVIGFFYGCASAPVVMVSGLYGAFVVDTAVYEMTRGQRERQSQRRFLDYAKAALKRGDPEAAYRLLEDGLVAGDEQIKSEYHEYLFAHPEILNAARQTFGIQSFEETLKTHGHMAEDIESKRLQIYKTVADAQDYRLATQHFEAVFGEHPTPISDPCF